MARPQGDWTDAPTPEYRQRMRDALEQRIRDFNREHPNPPPKGNAFDKVTEALNRELKQQVADIIAEKTGTTLDARNAALRDNLEAAAENGARLDWSGDSTCFKSVSWQDGVIDVVFRNDYAYSQPMELGDFLDFMEADSLGEYFNFELGQDYFAPKAKGRGK